MNVYDFDGTIYYPDCSIDFAFWCMNRHPAMYITFFPKALINLIRYKRGKMPRYRMMRQFYSFLTKIDDFDVQIERFWDKHEGKIAAWYLAQKRPDDLIISAAPTCIIDPIAKRLGVRAVATEYGREYGVFLNNLMAAKEKGAIHHRPGLPGHRELLFGLPRRHAPRPVRGQGALGNRQGAEGRGLARHG